MSSEHTVNLAMALGMTPVQLTVLLLLYYISFIERPFRIVYSEALPAQPRSNITVLRAERKEMERSTGIWRRMTGSPFQDAGPATETARCCLVAVFERGTISSTCAAERRQRRRWTCVVEQQSSHKYGGLGTQCSA